jgi:hypothetical protein
MAVDQDRRVLLTGWFGLTHGEATAGDVLSMEAVRGALDRAKVAYDVGWSPVMCPDGGMRLEQAEPEAYTDLLFVCGPIHGRAVRELHGRFAGCRRIAIGVSVLDAADPAVTGFHHVLHRDAPGGPVRPDLAAGAPTATVPVVGVFLAHPQPEYGERQRHPDVSRRLVTWLGTKDCARLPLDSRLDPRDWRLSATPGELESLVRRLDVVVTTRLHGLVLALRNGVPAVAVDPVAGGGKVSAQAAAWRWPAVAAAEEVRPATLDRHLAWCLSGAGRAAAAGRRSQAAQAAAPMLEELLRLL